MRHWRLLATLRYLLDSEAGNEDLNNGPLCFGLIRCRILRLQCLAVEVHTGFSLGPPLCPLYLQLAKPLSHSIQRPLDPGDGHVVAPKLVIVRLLFAIFYLLHVIHSVRVPVQCFFPVFHKLCGVAGQFTESLLVIFSKFQALLCVIHCISSSTRWLG
ncbi:hypothetical protein F5144DRAFT_273735 [Chaetomium tenue]|uniref:Uncharacterized protein n=1 Tax=Chaetomium tenue TaxID=1854479 RepID=A0ACB7P166_9PEZI|nr:hypothetical protein F5144DRAFT_273735 [Chaetomium globosum]